MTLDSTLLLGIATALGIGLLIGIERERAKGRGPTRAAAGVRTFALLALSGAMAQLVGPIGIAVTGAFVALATLASYRRTRTQDPGLTTEVAMIATFLLGVLAQDQTALAAALGVTVAVVLTSKSRMHRFAREALTQQELHDGLLLVAAAFVVLPMLPDRTIDPWQTLNLRKLWILVVAVMGVSAVGHVALRAFGARLGLAVAGLAGGFVSSTATIAAMGDKARAKPEFAAAFAAAGLISNIATLAQLAVVLGTLSPPLLRHAAIPLLASGLATVVVALASSWRAFSTAHDGAALAGQRAFELRHVLIFVSLVAAVMLLATIARNSLGDASLPWVLGASGFADVHAAAASAAQLNAAEQIDMERAMTAIAAAFVTNSLMKCVMAALRGGRAYAARLIPGTIVMVATFIGAVVLR